MTEDLVAQMARQLRTLRIDLPGVRWLASPQEEGALRGLITACYGDTYSYRALYQEGQLGRLWRQGALLSLGEFSREGDLIGHTGFWAKDPALGYLESGLSLVDPARRQGLRVDYKRVWRPLLEALAQHVAYLHQNTTTLHPMAQFYALKHMRALPTGFLPHYTVGERILGLNESLGPMHALVMTTRLGQEPAAQAVLPASAWRGWMEQVAQAAQIPTRPERPAAPGPARLDLIEDNAALGLRRSCLRGPAEAAAQLEGTQARVHVVHLPAVDGAGPLLEALLAQGFVPTGLRPHARRPHEWTLQALPDAQALEEGPPPQFADEALGALWGRWRQLCRAS